MRDYVFMSIPLFEKRKILSEKNFSTVHGILNIIPKKNVKYYQK